MKLKERLSWLVGTLQRHIFPRLEECWERPLTDKEQQLVDRFRYNIAIFILPR